jgi:kynurenine formamidase
MDEFVRDRVKQHPCLFLKTGFVQTWQAAEYLRHFPGSATATAVVASVKQVATATATPDDATRAGS